MGIKGAELCRLSYDAVRRLSEISDPTSTISYGYDTGDRLTARTDAKLKQTLYSYDSFGRLERMTDRKGLATSYAYDKQDRVISFTRPEGVTRLSYDALGRLAEIVASMRVIRLLALRRGDRARS